MNAVRRRMLSHDKHSAFLKNHQQLQTNTMACCAVLVGLSLLLVLSPATGGRIKNLPKIISFLQNNYLDGDQFAVVINVPAEKCSPRVKPDQNFLPDDSAQKVKRVMASTAGVYRGQQLLGAKQKPINEMSSYHPEYLLLVQSNPPENASYDPLLKELLDRDKHGCVVFYTHNSPCVNTCSTPEGAYSILPALDMLRNHKGPKAFVFRKVWKHNVGSVEGKSAEPRPLAHCYRLGRRIYATMSVWENYESQLRWEANIMEMNARVRLYRCDGGRCVRCVYENEADGRCMHPVDL
ncbi:hypothetical protein MHYP_G00205920 [Metynnis hypsauchen]